MVVTWAETTLSSGVWTRMALLLLGVKYLVVAHAKTALTVPAGMCPVAVHSGRMLPILNTRCLVVARATTVTIEPAGGWAQQRLMPTWRRHLWQIWGSNGMHEVTKETRVFKTQR